jgi:hypothetical protein
MNYENYILHTSVRAQYINARQLKARAFATFWISAIPAKGSKPLANSSSPLKWIELT